MIINELCHEMNGGTYRIANIKVQIINFMHLKTIGEDNYE